MITIGALTLSNFIWSDQFNYASVAQQIEPALNGASHIENTKLTAGRPITLTSDIEPAALFKSILSHSDTTLDKFAININGTDFNVMWLYNPIAVTGKPHQSYSDSEPDYFQDIILTLVTV
jgi:hypothetical protein